jgi:prefoldin subunit 5
MSQGKIIPLIADAELRVEAHTAAEIRELIDAVDAEIDALQAEIEAKLKQIIERLDKLEAGGTPEVSA